MECRYTLALGLLLFPGLARAADDPPEQLLSAGSQVYIRWDGIKAHREAFDKTALGKLMKGDAGKFVDSAAKQLEEGIGALLTVQSLLGGAAPEDLRKVQADAAHLLKLPGLLGDNGFILAAEVRGVVKPAGQVILIIPDAGAKPEPLFGTMRFVAGLAKLSIKEKKADGKTLYDLPLPGPVHLGWWVEGKHAVLALSTDSVEDTAKRMK